MRLNFGLAVAASVFLSVGVPAARGQQLPYEGNQAGPGVMVTPSGDPIYLNAPPVIAPTLQPAFYAVELLPRSNSHPWVMAPRSASLIPWNLGQGRGYRTSPYGDYSRFAYSATGPFPGLPRPSARIEKDRTHHKANGCVICP